jgi:hypothetical protein
MPTINPPAFPVASRHATRDQSNPDSLPDSSFNPYQAPSAGIESSGPQMPRSVVTTISLMGALLVWQIIILGGRILSDAPLGIPLVILILLSFLLAGMLRRMRLAWKWGRILMFIGVMFHGYSALTLSRFILAQNDPNLRELAIQMWPLTIIYYLVYQALGKPSSIEYFDLICPSCDLPTTLNADRWFQRARCRTCGREW